MSVPIYLIGPTASKKNDFALSSQQVFGSIELINLDSAQVYKELIIGANIPSDQEKQCCPHHLFSYKSVSETYNVCSYLKDLQQCLASVKGQPFVVGGTMMYLYQHLHGLVSLPSFSDQQKTLWKKSYGENSQDFLYNRLSDVDPLLARRISPSDKQRTQRALMVYDLTGQPLSHYQQDQKNKETSHISPNIIKLNYQCKEKHRENIKIRISRMCDQGLLDEVEFLYNQYPESHWPFWKYVGYRQLREYIEGRISLELALEKVYFATCQLAKRQKTWMKKFSGPEIYVDSSTAQKDFLDVCRSILNAS